MSSNTIFPLIKFFCRNCIFSVWKQISSGNCLVESSQTISSGNCLRGSYYFIKDGLHIGKTLRIYQYYILFINNLGISDILFFLMIERPKKKKKWVLKKKKRRKSHNERLNHTIFYDFIFFFALEVTKNLFTQGLFFVH